MRTAQQIIDDHLPSGMMLTTNLNNAIKKAINEAQLLALTEAANKVRTYKVGNSGSWYDAGIDKLTILNLIKEIK